MLKASSMGGKSVLKICFTFVAACCSQHCRERDQPLPNPCHFCQQRYLGGKQKDGPLAFQKCPFNTHTDNRSPPVKFWEQQHRHLAKMAYHQSFNTEETATCLIKPVTARRKDENQGLKELR